MKASLAKAIIQDCRDRGYVEYNGVFYPPAQAAALNIVKPDKKKRSNNLVKTGWTDDERNLKNKKAKRDVFMMLIDKQLQLDVWPEFYFSTERLFRFDYAIPEHKIAIEQEGGIWAKGNSGHSSGKGISRDMEKSNLAQANGWVVVRRTPDQMITMETIELIKAVIRQRLVLL